MAHLECVDGPIMLVHLRDGVPLQDREDGGREREGEGERAGEREGGRERGWEGGREFVNRNFQFNINCFNDNNNLI